MTKAVFLDRDGVLNVAAVRDGKPHPPAALEQVVIYPDAAGALAALNYVDAYDGSILRLRSISLATASVKPPLPTSTVGSRE